MNRNIIDRDKCSGCKVCKVICPYNAIDFITTDEGFWFPQKNDNCINCGLCEKKCPMINKISFDKNIEQQAFFLRHKNEDVLNRSTSGGAFTAIAQTFCDKDYVIIGAQYNEEFKVEHSYIEDITEIDKFRKSKYVQSDSGGIYEITKKFLEDGKKVLFSGTPCQIAALRQYLQVDYDNLLTIDIICHGAPNPNVFEEYKKYIEKKYNSKIKSLEFRVKNINVKNSKNVCINFENNKKIIFYNNRDLYLKCFDNLLLYRSACSSCKFANPKRYSDITIGDAWGIEHIYKNLNVHDGHSMIVINTEKGKKIFEMLKKDVEIRNVTLEYAIKANSQFREPTKLNPKRKEFYDRLEKRSFDKVVDEFCCVKFASRLKRKILKILKIGDKV